MDKTKPFHGKYNKIPANANHRERRYIYPSLIYLKKVWLAIKGGGDYILTTTSITKTTWDAFQEIIFP